MSLLNTTLLAFPSSNTRRPKREANIPRYPDSSAGKFSHPENFVKNKNKYPKKMSEKCSFSD